MTMATYVTNLVQLIGLGIAVDYSLLIVYRFREELERRAARRTTRSCARWQTAGRAVVFSGATVAIGLSLLLFMPLPFMRSMGVGGFLIPLVSIAAAATLQPALLSVYGRRGTRRVHVARVPARRGVPLPQLAGDDGHRARLLGAARALDHAPSGRVPRSPARRCSSPARSRAARSQLTPGSAAGDPADAAGGAGLNVLRGAVGPGALSPTQILVDAGRAGRRATPRRAGRGRRVWSARLQARSRGRARRGRGPAAAASSTRAAATRRLIVAGEHEYGDAAVAGASSAGCATTLSPRPASRPARACSPAAGRRRESTSSHRSLRRTSRGSCSPCSC